jgi:DNA repair protein RecN (Recombination protein N)
MIHRLYIRDFAVIDELSLEFGPGLNLLTGETGSGKSIIVDAIGIALGERSESDAVRTGRDRAIVEAVIDVSSSPIAVDLLNQAGIAVEDGCIVVTREVQRGGKSQCRINNRPTTASLLKEVTDHLVDTHGQHEHQFLLRSERHLDVLDAWYGANVLNLREKVSSGYSELRRLRAELDELTGNERERSHLIDLYSFQAKEIADAHLVPDEEEELQAESVRLSNAERLNEAASAAFESIGDRSQDRTALDLISDGLRNLEGIASLDAQLEPIVEGVRGSLFQLEDAARELRGYRDSVEFNPERLEEVLDRLDRIRTLKKKYGESIADVMEYGRDIERRLTALTNSDERSSELQGDIDRLQAKVLGDAERLSSMRREGAEAFSAKVQGELASLSMPDAVFRVSFERSELDARGIDKVEFLITANPGEPPRPLAKIASGGELSRTMLAMKSASAALDNIPTLIFDEIDVGVGGRTADVIGDKLDYLAARGQVLCITHLPQIACRRGEHFYIEKSVREGRTLVSVRKLSDEDRVIELSRMLGGSNPTEAAVRHAREMLGMVEDGEFRLV